MKNNFKGTGSLVEFVNSANALFSAINNVQVIVPKNYVGVEPTLKLNEDGEKSSLVFDFGDALIFTENNISFN
jgi:hypothetical protein